MRLVCIYGVDEENRTDRENGTDGTNGTNGTNGIDGIDGEDKEDRADRADRADRTIKTIKKKINLLLEWCSSGADMKKARMGSTWCTSHSGF